MKNRNHFSSVRPLATLGVALATASVAFADHGRGTSGGGVLTQSGETLKPGAFSIEFREDYTEFQRLSQAEVEATTPRTDYQGTTYYFCSKDCRVAFLKSPQKYLPKVQKP